MPGDARRTSQGGDFPVRSFARHGLGVFLAVLVVLLSTAVRAETPAFTQTQLVPAYFSPQQGAGGGAEGPWAEMCDAMKAPSMAIMNPSSGPGEGVRAEYVEALRYCHDSGNEVVGYVDTAYGQRPMDAVKADIRNYYRWYTVDGIFLDQMSAEPDGQAAGGGDMRSYYRDLYAFINDFASPGKVVGNPGAASTDDWQFSEPVADVVVVFEGYAEEYAGWSPPEWVYRYPAARFSHLVHTAPAERRHELCVLSQERNGGRVFITDEALSAADDGVFAENPWDGLPSYWNLIAPKCV
jgi:hypothetical protein